jgi:hypothetical protein
MNGWRGSANLINDKPSVATRDPDRERRIRAIRLRGALLNEFDENYLIRCLDETRASLRRVVTLVRAIDNPDEEALAAIAEAEHLL